MSLGSALAVTMMIGMKGKRRVGPQTPADLEPVQLRHHHVEQDEVWLRLLDGGERLPRRRSR